MSSDAEDDHKIDDLGLDDELNDLQDDGGVDDLFGEDDDEISAPIEKPCV